MGQTPVGELRRVSVARFFQGSQKIWYGVKVVPDKAWLNGTGATLAERGNRHLNAARR